MAGSCRELHRKKRGEGGVTSRQPARPPRPPPLPSLTSPTAPPLRPQAMLPARLAARLDLDGFCRASPATLHELWRRVEARYGSVDGYMSAIGVAPSTRAALRDALTAPRPPAEGGPAAGGERGQ